MSDPTSRASSEAVAAAGALMRQYGADAAVIATLRAAEEAARSDLEASDHWMSVAALLEEP
ncbi:MAG: hypothetical protein KJS97_03460 [Alphaproteobacteria bacterium]|nr:hypothetical protein [Alphaproteobacteria bacterium]